MKKKSLKSNPLEDKDDIMKDFYNPPSKNKPENDSKPSGSKARNTAVRKDDKPESQKAANTALQQAGNTALHKLTIRLPKDLIKKAKRSALDKDISVQDLVKEALNKYLEK